MSLPEQIQRQVDEAKDIIAKHYGTEAQADPQPDASAADQAPPAEGSEPAPAATVVTQPVGDDDKTYEQRWRSLQGIYNSTAQQLKAQESRMRDLENLIASLQTAPRTEPAPAKQHVTDSDVETFGVDEVDMMRRAAREELAPFVGALSALREEVAALKGLAPVVNTVAANQRVSAEEKFFGQLTERVSDWQTINANRKFHEWLLTPDPMTGITRQTYLEEAQRSFDILRTVNIFGAWKQVSGTSTVTPGKTHLTSVASELELQVAPGRKIATPAPASSEGRQWKTTEITAFYDDVRRGLYKGKEAERVETERDIFAAQREGRVLRVAA